MLAHTPFFYLLTSHPGLGKTAERMRAQVPKLACPWVLKRARDVNTSTPADLGQQPQVRVLLCLPCLAVSIWDVLVLACK